MSQINDNVSISEKTILDIHYYNSSWKKDFYQKFPYEIFSISLQWVINALGYAKLLSEEQLSNFYLQG